MRPKIRLVIATIAFLIPTAISLLALRQSQRSNQIADQALRSSQAVYANPEGAFVDPDQVFTILNPKPHTVSRPGNIHVKVSVSGLTPAQNVRTTMECRSGDWETGQTTPAENVSAIYPPNVPQEFVCSPSLLRGRNPESTGSYIDQNKSILPGAISVKGLITYEDILHTRYSREFCFQNESGWNRRDLSQCKTGNNLAAFPGVTNIAAPVAQSTGYLDPLLAIVAVIVAVAAVVVAIESLQYMRGRDLEVDTRSGWIEIHKAMINVRVQRAFVMLRNRFGDNSPINREEAVKDYTLAAAQLRAQLNRLNDDPLIIQLGEFLDANKLTAQWQTQTFEQDFDAFVHQVAMKSRPQEPQWRLMDAIKRTLRVSVLRNASPSSTAHTDSGSRP